MKRIYRTLILCIMAFSFFQCQKDLSYYGEADPIPDTTAINKVNPEPITANLQGNILDENNQPAAGVNITVDNKTATTNAAGYFRIVNAPLDKKSALVVAEKSGYFKGYRVFAATSGTNQVIIKLIKKVLAGTVTASTGGDATLGNGSKITLAANSVVVASSGAAYTGNVKVYASYIDPTATDISKTVPGSFDATDKRGSRVVLSSYGMLAVELQSDAGEKLQIKNGSVASLTTAIPGGVSSSAPATISLWSVDETTGLWKEEGTATKQGNNYVGDVTHFSFWNCDQPLNAVYISMTLQTTDSLPLVHAIVRITRSGSGFQTTTYGWTDTLGQVGGMVPANENLLIEVLDPCGNAIFTQNVLPLTQNTNLGTITVSSSTTVLNTLHGILLDCSGSPVTNGYAVITVDNIVRYAATDSTGAFATTFITCAAPSSVAQVIGVDNTSQQQSSLTSVNITAPLTNTGSITACGTVSAQYINYTLDGTNYSISDLAGDSLTAYTSTPVGGQVTNIQGNTGTVNQINFSVTGAYTTGSYPSTSFNVQQFMQTGITPATIVNFTKFAAVVGDFYEGNITGSFIENSTSTNHTVSATFRIRRSF